MKNGVLRFIPLQADLCLNKQKVDIEDFKGWQKCNAPVYGDCLSPLYFAFALAIKLFPPLRNIVQFRVEIN